MIDNELHISPAYFIEDDRFTIEEIADSKLTIEISDSFFRFSIKNELDKIVWLEDFSLAKARNTADHVQSIIENHRFLSVRFWDKIQVLIHAKQKTFVPIHLENQSLADRYLQSLFGLPMESTIQLSKRGSYLYHTNEEILNFFKEFYPEDKLILHLADSALENEPAHMLIFHQEGASLFVHENHQNVFFVNDLKAVIEYIKNKDLSNVKLCGEITEYAKNYKVLENAGLKAELIKHAGDLRFSQYFQDCPFHRYYLLFRAS